VVSASRAARGLVVSAFAYEA